MKDQDRPALSLPWIPAMGRGLEAARLFVLVACVLGVFWLQDAASADALAPKSLWFCVALGFLPALSALRLWWDRPLRLPSARVLGALALFAAAATASYLASPLAETSRTAWQAWLLAALLLAASVDLFSEGAGRLWFLRALVLGAGLAGLRSLAQRFHLDTSLAATEDAQAFGARVAGCFGNPNFAGGCFVLVLPVLIHQAFAAEGRFWRWVARAAAALALLGLLFSAGKAALLGFAVSLAVAGHLFFWSEAAPGRRRQGLRFLAGLALAAFLAGALALPRAAAVRLSGGPSAWSESVSFRRVTWTGAWNLFLARPVVGWGPGTFSAAYPPFRPARAMAGQAQHSYEVTAPENWILQFLDESGVLGLAACLGLLAVLILPLRAEARGWDQDPGGAGLCLALLCGVAASLACNLASLDLFLPSTLLPLLLMLGLGAALTTRKAPTLSVNPETYARVLVSVALCFMAAVPAVQGLLHLQAARRLAQARFLSQSGRFADAVPDYGLAVQFDPGLLEARYFMGCDYLDLGGAANLTQAEQAFTDLRAYAPDYVLVHAKLGRLYQTEGRTDEAIAQYARQLALDPWDLDTVRALAGLDAANGRLADAAAVLEGASKRWPGDADIAHNLGLVRAALLARTPRQKGNP